MRVQRSVLAGLAIVALLAGCARTLATIPGLGPGVSEEERIAAILNDVHQGLESKRIFKVLAHVSRDYRDSEGRDYNGLASFLDRMFKQYSEIRVARQRPRIVVEGNRARAVETFGTVASPMPESNVPRLNIQGQVTVYFARVGDTWQIIEWGHLR